jgi:FkbM family methyltransferase
MLGVPPLSALLMRALVRPTDGNMYRTRVLSGPARGMRVTMPNRERLSYALGRYERHVVNTTLSFLRPGDTAYDVGANVGYITLAMARAVGPSGHVVACEADPVSAQVLRANVSDNGLSTVSVVEAAVSDHTGDVEFARWPHYSLIGHIAGESEPSDATMVTVQAVRLDDLLDSHPAPRVVKIDVEGAEAAVLRGACTLLRSARPFVLVEVRSTEWPAVNVFMRQHGYTSRPLSGRWDMARDGLSDVLFLPSEHRASSVGRQQ